MNFSGDLNPYARSITKPTVIREEWSLLLQTKINSWISSKACGCSGALIHITSPHMYIQTFNIQILGIKMFGCKSLSSPDTTLHKYDFNVVDDEIYMDK